MSDCRSPCPGRSSPGSAFLDPDVGTQDGPYVLVGSDEYTLNEARALGDALVALADLGSGATRRVAAGTRSRGP